MHGGTPNTQQGIRIAVDELKDIVTGGRIAALTGHYDMTDLRLADDVNRLLGVHYATIDARRDVLPTIKRGITQMKNNKNSGARSPVFTVWQSSLKPTPIGIDKWASILPKRRE